MIMKTWANSNEEDRKMKKSLYIGVAAIAALALSSCQKEANFIDKSMVTITLTADKAGDVTKAAANEGSDKVTYTWTSTDLENLKLLAVTESSDGKETFAEVEKTTTLSSDNRTLSITATVEAGTKLRAAVSSEWTGNEGATDRKPRQPMIQHPAADNFDPAADILVSEDVTVTGNLAEEKLTFHRPVTVNKLTLKGMVAGEAVSKVTLTSDKDLTGYYQYDKGAMSGQHNELNLLYDEPVAVASSGEFPVYFTAMPNAEQKLTLVVETSQDSKDYRYVVEGISPISFTQGKFARFSVDLDGYRKEVEDVDYSGEWVIGGTSSDHQIAATQYSSGYVYPASEGDVVTVTGDAAPYKMTITRITSGDNAGFYTIVDAGGKYLSATGGTSNNNMQGKDTPDETSYFTIAKNPDGTYDVVADKLADNARKSMRVNWNNGNPRVSCYSTSSSMAKVVLYPFDKVKVAEPPSTRYQFQKVAAVTSGKQYLIVANDGNDLQAAKPITGGFGYPAVEKVTDVDGIITVSVMTNAFTFTSEADGYTIKQSDDRYWYLKGTYTSFNVDAAPTEGQYFTFAKNDDGTFKITNVAKDSYVQYSTGHTSYGCYPDEQGIMPFLYEYIGEGGTTPTEYDFTTVAELNAKVTQTSAEYSGKLTNAVVSFVPQSNTAIIKDATGSIMYYKKDHGLKQGQTFSGDLTVAAIKYNGLYSEITDLGTAAFSGDGAEVAPEEVTIATLIGQYDKYQNAYVKASNLKVVSKSGKNINVTDGTNAYVIFDNTNSVSCAADDVINTVVGTVTKYGETEEIKVWAASDIDITAGTGPGPGGDEKTYTITWNATNNSAEISSYTDTWSVTSDGLTCTMVNWNNNKNSWNYVKAGRKNNASVATITTAEAIPEAIKSVTLTIDAVTANKINSLKLYVSSSSDFTGATSYDFAVEAGDKAVTITSPGANQYYQIEADCDAGSSNGLITVSKLVFTCN